MKPLLRPSIPDTANHIGADWSDKMVSGLACKADWIACALTLISTAPHRLIWRKAPRVYPSYRSATAGAVTGLVVVSPLLPKAARPNGDEPLRSGPLVTAGNLAIGIAAWIGSSLPHPRHDFDAFVGNLQPEGAVLKWAGTAVLKWAAR
jgi:hypothetical protein